MKKDVFIIKDMIEGVIYELINKKAFDRRLDLLLNKYGNVKLSFNGNTAIIRGK